MSELSREARSALDAGLRDDGPSDEQRARVKARLLVALGTGAAALGGSAAAAEAASVAATGATVAAAEGLAVGSLLIWFGAGAAAGVGVSGVVVAARYVATPHAAVSMSARPPSAPSVVPQPDLPVHGAPVSTSAADGEAADETPSVRAPAPSVVAPSAVTALPVANPPSAPNPPPVASAAPVASTLSEEAALLERAQRALAANAPSAALAVLSEHERRFPAGALREERQAAKVLAFCALGRVAEARTLARAFVSTAPGSVLVPRLERSCVGADVKAR